MSKRSTLSTKTDDSAIVEGDIVELKSGGPKMSVHEVYPRTERVGVPQCICVWFVDYFRYDGVFSVAALKKVSVRKKSNASRAR